MSVGSVPQQPRRHRGDDALRDLQLLALTSTDRAFSISGPRQPDNPLVWVNPAFTTIMGYDADATPEAMCAAVVDHAGSSLEDDIAVLAVRLTSPELALPTSHQAANKRHL